MTIQLGDYILLPLIGTLRPPDSSPAVSNEAEVAAAELPKSSIQHAERSPACLPAQFLPPQTNPNVSARPEQSADERAARHLRHHARVHRHRGDEPARHARHDALPHHLRHDRVLLLRPLHAVRHQPAAAAKVQVQYNKNKSERLTL